MIIEHGLSRLVITNKNVALLPNRNVYELATDKSTSISCKMLRRMGGNRRWPEIKKKLEEAYSPFGTEVCAASDLHRRNDLVKPYMSIFRILQT